MRRGTRFARGHGAILCAPLQLKLVRLDAPLRAAKWLTSTAVAALLGLLPPKEPTREVRLRVRVTAIPRCYFAPEPPALAVDPVPSRPRPL
jgi:hypothetical protein